MMAIFLPDLINKLYIEVDFLHIITFVPIFSRIIHPEIEGHIILICKTKKHLHEIYRRIIYIFSSKDRFKRCGDPTAESRTDKHDSIDAHIPHCTEIPVPFLYSPVLMRDIPAYLIQESSIYRHTFQALWGLELIVGKFASVAAGYGNDRKDDD